MNKKQLWLLYGITIFMLLFGFNFISYGLLQHDYATALTFSPFDITSFIYITLTLLSVRLVLRHNYPEKRFLRITLLLLVLIPAFILCRYALEEIICPKVIGKSNYFDNITIQYYITDNLTYALYYITIGILLYLFDYNIYSIRKVKLLESQNREAELNYLQTQFNPHFLFNSLNNIYALVSEKSEHAGEAVMRLSDMARFLIEEKKSECLLEEEIQQMNNFIDLQRLRFDYALPIVFEATGPYANKHIPTFTLVTCIENAFKHGDFKDDQNPLQINITATNTELHIVVKNKIGKHNKDTTSGVGLKNISKRLLILYPNQHRLTCSIQNNSFILDLTINN